MSKIKKVAEQQVVDYLFTYMDDPQLNVWHLAILNAILSLGYRQGEKQKIKVSRRKLMLLSHINTLPTYHKYFKQLQDLGYIKYRPSYHPDCGSEVELYKERLSHN